MEFIDAVRILKGVKMIAQVKTITPNLKSQATGNFFTVVELVNGQKLYAWKDTIKQALMSLQPGMQADFRLKGEGTQYPAIEDVVPVYAGGAPAAQTGIPATESPPNQWQDQPQQLTQGVIDPGVSAPANQPPDPPAPIVEDPTQQSIESQCALKSAVDAVIGFQAMLWNETPTQGSIQETILHFHQVFLQIIRGKIGGAK